jgi:hypothetical protein
MRRRTRPRHPRLWMLLVIPLLTPGIIAMQPASGQEQPAGETLGRGSEAVTEGQLARATAIAQAADSG